ncbi:AAA family ATPase [Candidatus Woesearchaeota archaeon]|nr:AAA family ATPase [Candidatus Woesearchaeota archaeon]
MQYWTQKYNTTAKKLIQENGEKDTELVNNKIIEVINNGFKNIKSNYNDKKTMQFLENMQKDMLTDPLKIYRFSKIPESINNSILKEEGDYLDREKIQEFGKNLVNRYKINLLVDNSKTKNAPVIFEINPTYSNVIGTILKDKLISLNEENDDHLRTEAGSAIKANEGFLVLNANDLITKEDCLHTLDALSRVIKNREVAIENIRSEQKTDLAKAKTKVIMLGDESAFYLMQEYFLKFESCFKIKAEFSRTIPNNEENINRYMGFFNSFTTKNNLKPLDDSAAASMIEYSARCGGSKDRLTARFGSLADVIREANIFAKNEPLVTAKHISKALENKIEINSTLEEELSDFIKKDYTKIDLKGTKVGEINGLEVFLSTGYDFGLPFKMIAKVSLTDAGSNENIVNVEGEVGYSDKSWDKGMLVLYSHLRGRHAKDKPMPLNISISHAQEEDMWGNSAILASSLAVYSDFTGLPTKQNIAVTGFMNEAGDVLCIGGVNEKIEGFYKICKLMKINDGGVVIPKSNIRDLMLNDEVIKAVKSNNFKIYAVGHIDEAKEIMMDKKAATINRIADKKIEEANQILSRYRR